MKFSKEWDALVDYKLLTQALAHDKERRKNKFVYPPPKNVLRMFQELDPSEIRVFFVFQDPYHSPGLANGRAVAVNEGQNIPYTLKMLDENLFDNMGENINDYTLNHWVEQGVFLMNSALSVEHGEPGSLLLEWEPFTDDIMHKLSQKYDPVFVLLGAYAKRKKKFLENQVVVEAAHPAAERYKRGIFSEADIFDRINEELSCKDLNPITWS